MEFCRYEKKGHVAYLTITRPQVMNSLHPAASRELAGAWDDFAADDDAWVAVFTGEGDRAFSAGNDLKNTAEMSRLPREQRPDQSMPPSGFGGITNRFDLFKPIIARVNGFALGGGLEMALAFDLIIAADHAELGLPEPRRGLIAGALGVHRLPRAMSLKAAMGHLLTGRHMTAEEAHRLGVINEVVPLAQLMPTALKWAGEILECAPLSIRASKQAALMGLGHPLDIALNMKYTEAEAMRRSEDTVEGPRAFAEKRKPSWKAR